MEPPIAWTCKRRTEWEIGPTEASRDDAVTGVVTRVVRPSAVTALKARAPATTMSTTVTTARTPSTIHCRVRDGMRRVTIGFGLARGRRGEDRDAEGPWA